MSSKHSNTHDDPWLIKSFKEFENMPVTSKSDLDWSVTIDFQVFSEYLIKDISEMRDRLRNADDEYLYYVCGHIFNIIDWMTLMVVDAGFPTFAVAFERLFEEHFGDEHILQNMYDSCFEQWVSKKIGQQKIGENFYNIIRDTLYYRNRFGRWFEVDRRTAFDLKPKKELIEDKSIIKKLNSEYKETWYDAILKQWDKQNYKGRLSDDFLVFDDEETSPEAYFDFTTAHINTLLKHPISIAELERWNGGEIEDLEDIVKICVLVLDIVNNMRKEDSHTIYLLRDCLMFYEAHTVLDVLCSEHTSADQVLVGRKLLSHKSREWGYYVLTLASLYDAHTRHPAHFDDFYREYARLLDTFASLNPGFASVIDDLADYIKKHIRTDKEKIVIFDVGFQGSIALLTKYIIDHHVRPSNEKGHVETDVKVAVGAVWSKELFGDRHEGDYFPFLNRLQLATRSDELYHYKPDSLSGGTIRVVMGEKNKQHDAAVELVVLVMVALLSHANKREGLV